MTFNKKATSALIALIAVGIGWTVNTRVKDKVSNDQTNIASQVEHNTITGTVPKSIQSYTGSTPVTTKQTQIVLKNIGYLVGYSPSRRGPIWAGYGLNWNITKHDGFKRPTSGFQPDERVPNPIVTEDYTHQGYDRGHLAPSFAIGKFHGREAQIETFLLTNISPQLHKMNDGTWNSIERMESDDFAKRFGSVYVTCGPIFAQDPNSFPSGVAIPIAFFKVIRRPDNQTIAFIVPQEASNQRPEQFLTSINKIEKYTGLNIYPDLTLEEKNRVRTKIW